MIRKWVALGLLLVAVAGLVIGIVGIATTRHLVTTKHLQVEYDISSKTYYKVDTEEKYNFSSEIYEKAAVGDALNGDKLLTEWFNKPTNQNYSDEWKEIPKKAEGQHGTPIWIGFIIFVVFGVAALSTWKSIKYY